MEIDYKCDRCDKTVKAKVTKKSFSGHANPKKEHIRLDCTECGKYIKFIGHKEFDEISQSTHKDDFEEHPDYPEDNGGLDEINFKLDLILYHLGIMQRSEP